MLVRDRLSVEVVGQGPDVVLVPGLASSRETWRATAERLRGRFRLHLVNVAGFAGEPARANATGEVVAPTAEAIDAYVVEQKLTPAVLVGHSLGGTMALYLAQKHPEHLRKVMLVDSLPFFGVLMGGPSATAESVRPMAEAIKARMTAPGATDGAGQSAQIAGMVTSPADRDRVIGWGRASDRSVVARAFAEDMTLDLRPGLATMRVPITLLYPDNGPNGMPPGVADRLYEAAFSTAPKKTLTRVDSSRHFIMYDQPQAFAAALDAFLGS